MQIIRDTREQDGYSFSGFPEVEAISGTLTTGDYSLPGFEDRVAVERKSLPDLLGCLTHDRERFVRELERLRGYESTAIVVEASYGEILAGRYRSRMTPAAAAQSIVSIMERYRMPFFFAGSHMEGEAFVFDFLRHYHRHACERYKALNAYR